MIFSAYSSDTNKMLSLPETGMGYQIIEGMLTSGYITKRFVVYNSELIVDLNMVLRMVDYSPQFVPYKK